VAVLREFVACLKNSVAFAEILFISLLSLSCLDHTSNQADLKKIEI
jgi:hypothetical protein